jgi:hypothetical protein
MPGYIQAMLHKYQHVAPRRAQHSPLEWIKPNYGAKQQLTPLEDESKALLPADIKRIQQITGTLLYYGRAVDCTILNALGSIAAQQANATEATAKAVKHLLDYCHTHPDATIRYHASDMILRVHSDASYLSESKARSRSGGYFYLGNSPGNKADVHNGALLSTSTIMRNVMSSAAEAECGALFNNTKDAVPLRISLEEMGYHQPTATTKRPNCWPILLTCFYSTADSLMMLL